MALTNKYANFDLVTGNNDGTTEADAWQTWDSLTGGVTGGDHVYVKKTASRWGSNSYQTISVNGTNGNPIVLEGYDTVTGDDGFFESSDGFGILGDYILVKNFDVYTTNISYGINAGGNASSIYRCKSVMLTANGSTNPALSSGDSGFVIDSYAESYGLGTTYNRAVITVTRGIVIGCTAVNQGPTYTIGVYGGYRSSAARGNLLICNGAHGIYIEGTANLNSPMEISNNTIYNCNDGIRINDAPKSTVSSGIAIMYNIIYSASGYGLNLIDVVNCYGMMPIIGNAIGSYTSGRSYGLQNYEEVESIELTTDPFTNSSGGDFTLNNESGGGALCRSIGAPKFLNYDGTQTSFSDIGALQHEDGGGGSNAVAF